MVYRKISNILLASLLMICAEGYAMQTDSVAQKSEKKERVEIVALKNNLLYDAIATPNLQLEFRLAPKWSLEFGVGFNPFPLDDTKFPKWRHLMVSVAPRYWFCNVFHRDFISVNAAYVMYNVAGGVYPIGWMYPQVIDNRFEGHAALAGASYGWHFAISPHFSIELEAGVDAGYAWYTQYECKHCGDKTGQGGRWVVLPKLGINLSVPLGGDDQSLARRCDCEKIEEKEPKDEIREIIEETPAEEPVVVPVEEPEEEWEPLIPAERLLVPMAMPNRVIASVPPIEPMTDSGMRRLRSRLLRPEDEYEPYDSNMALSADSRNVFLFFEVDVTKLDRSFIQNNLLMDSIMTILGEATSDPHIRISHIRIVGFASFDGRMNYNIGLAGSRAQTIKQYMQGEFPQLHDSIFAVCNGGESWAELRYQLQSVEFEGRDEVLHIIDTEPNADKREVMIKKLNGGKTYIYMRDELRHILRNLGCITIYCDTNVE